MFLVQKKPFLEKLIFVKLSWKYWFSCKRNSRRLSSHFLNLPESLVNKFPDPYQKHALLSATKDESFMTPISSSISIETACKAFTVCKIITLY